MNIPKRLFAFILSVSMIVALLPPMPAMAAQNAPDEISVINTTVSASVNQLKGNNNELTITINDIYGKHVKTFIINNNAAGIYKVGDYEIFVDTKGNTQIRDCYIVSYNPTTGDIDYIVNPVLPPGQPEILDTDMEITVLTAFPDGVTTEHIVDVTYTVTADSKSSISEISEVSYSINDNAAEYIFLADADNITQRGTLGRGRVLLMPGENNIIFTARDVAGRWAKFAISNQPYYDFGSLPEYDPEYIEPSDDSDSLFVTNRIVVFAKNGITKAQVEAVITTIGGIIVGQTNAIRMYIIQLPINNTAFGLLDLCAKLLSEYPDLLEDVLLDKIDNIELDTIISPPSPPTNDKWSSKERWGIDAINTPVAWAGYSAYFQNLRVGVVDSGFRHTHDDLQIPSNNVINRSLADENHGTHVIGTIGAIHNNNKGLAGVININRNSLFGCNAFNIVHEKYFLWWVTSRSYSASQAAIITCLTWNVQRGAKVINFSMGFSEDHDNDAYNNNMRELLKQGYDFIVVQSAGNNGTDASRNRIFPPATSGDLRQRIITVGATGSYSNGIGMPVFSNHGETAVDVLAPGVTIYSTTAKNDSSYSNDYSGTSMAAPHVTGVTALVWAANPKLTGEQVKQKVVESAREYGQRVFNSRGEYYQVDALAAVALSNQSKFVDITNGSKHLGDRITNGQRINKMEYIASPNKKFIAIMQGDGNFVIYNTLRALWASNTVSRGEYFTLQNDGNLIIFDNRGLPVWSPNIQGRGVSTLIMQDDGNLVAYTDNGRAVWWSGITDKSHSWWKNNSSGIINDVTLGVEFNILVSVSDITGVPTTATAGTLFTLTGTVSPVNATNRTIVWSIVNVGTTGATISGNTLNVSAGGIVTVRATIVNGRAAGINYTQDFNITVNVPFIPVTGISGVPTTATAGTPLTLSGTVFPANATHSNIVWSVVNTGTTGATISGNILNATSVGVVTVRATIINGRAAGTNYTQDFSITVNVPFIPVTGISDIPTTATAGTALTLSGTVSPANATNRNIVWSVVNAGITGATISGSTLNASAGGTVTVRATIVNGRTVSTNYTQDFNIAVSTSDSLADFYEQVAAYQFATENITIQVELDLTLDRIVYIPAPQVVGVTLTITSTDAANPVTLTRDVYGNLFYVDTDATLLLEDIIIDGDRTGAYGNDGGGSLVFVNGGGSLTMNDGAVLRNNYAINSGGGVGVEGGTFTMTGGKISGNAAGVGGGVSVAGTRTNLVNGVLVNIGTFTMMGGEISGNFAGGGGGVFVWPLDSIFTMSGGAISNNTVEYNGGGVSGSGTFIMTGGEITNNSASGYYGGGVYIWGGGTFIMSDGIISGNSAGYYGGGMSLTSSWRILEDGRELVESSTFIMTGGKISGNTASLYGGVFVGRESMINLGGTSVISGNTPNNVYLDRDSFITLSTDIPLAPGMEIWVTKISDDGVIVEYGAGESDEAYFFADEPGKKVSYDAGRLRIVDVDATVGSFAALQTAIGAYRTALKNTVIDVAADFSITGNLAIPANSYGATLTLKSANAVNPITLTRGVTGTLFTVVNGAKLIFENITIDGGSTSGYSEGVGSLINVNSGGSFTINSGTVLRNNNGGVDGGGVRLGNNGQLTMTGGKIIGNTTNGVAVGNGVFTMFGGEISDNRYGANVQPLGVFNMSGGKISNNSSTGVTVFGEFTMSNGQISNNSSGVRVHGEFTMSGGNISGNISIYGRGAGVYIGEGVFTMTGGKITGNTAQSGGGVGVERGGFTMLGGEISGNTASWGGGVISFGEFVIGGAAVISGNTGNGAVNNIYLGNGRYIILSTGTPPDLSMSVGVHTETPDGVIVEYGASAGDAKYFFADESDKVVVFDNYQLVIK